MKRTGNRLRLSQATQSILDAIKTGATIAAIQQMTGLPRNDIWPRLDWARKAGRAKIVDSVLSGGKIVNVYQSMEVSEAALTFHSDDIFDCSELLKVLGPRPEWLPSGTKRIVSQELKEDNECSI